MRTGMSLLSIKKKSRDSWRKSRREEKDQERRLADCDAPLKKSALGIRRQWGRYKASRIAKELYVIK